MSLLLQEKRALTAALTYTEGVIFGMISAGGDAGGSVLFGYAIDLRDMLKKALEGSNPRINETRVREVAHMVSNSIHVPSAELGTQLLTLLKTTT